MTKCALCGIDLVFDGYFEFLHPANKCLLAKAIRHQYDVKKLNEAIEAARSEERKKFQSLFFALNRLLALVAETDDPKDDPDWIEYLTKARSAIENAEREGIRKA